MRKIPFVNLGAQYKHFREEILESFDSISSEGHFIGGKIVEDFEKEFASYCGTKFAVGVANGTDAIVLALRAYGIQCGDEVITAPNSFIASAGAINEIGATPRFCDVGDDYNLDPKKLEECITKKTRAILPVHLTGMPADMDPINEIAKKYNLIVIEDAAQAAGADYKGKKVGNLGDAGAFSLHPLKNLFLHGDAGIITLNDEDQYRELLRLRSHGLVDRDRCKSWAVNSRIDAIQAAIGSIKLKEMDRITTRMQQISRMYSERLSDITEIRLPVRPENRKGVFHNFVILTTERDELMRHLQDCGVDTKIHYPIPIHMQEAAKYLGHKDTDFPTTLEQSKKIMSLPIYPELSDEDVKYVCSSLRSYYNK